MTNKIYDVAIVGAGNVASGLCHIFLASGVSVAIVARNTSKVNIPIDPSHIYNLEEPPPAAIYLIAVKDAHVAQVASKLYPKVSPTAIIVHSAGSVAMNALPAQISNAGVFYPLQTFSQGREEHLGNFTIFVEATNPATLDALEQLAQRCKLPSYHIDSQARERMHIAAVFVSNFTNFMYTSAEDILRSSGVGFEHMRPLMRECAAKVQESTLSPALLQTGPAARGDMQVAKHHIDLLDEPELKQIYSVISDAIYKRYNEKL